MAKYKNYVGVTETSDPGVNENWKLIKKLHQSNIIITKHLEDGSFREFLIDNSSKIILHATITGWGSTNIEPGVENYQTAIDYVSLLLADGFPYSNLVIRIDPIIPTPSGFVKVINLLSYINSKKWNETYQGGLRVRVSIMDMYKHIQKKMMDEQPDLGFSYNGTHMMKVAVNKTNSLIRNMKEKYQYMTFEACAEHELTECDQRGCVSQKDIKILGLTEKVKLLGKSHQRKECMCPDNKIQLLGGYYNRPKCTSGCKYCYMK